ncbi:MAG: 1-acyl-sn-glycerol-3-phosphate acyltransferase [Polaromonas sp.]|nr:1-acyl-sn-glycerol-3-phosphate acyltransferase [Polaromonas sp.]
MKPLRTAWRAWRALAHVLGGLWTIRRHFGQLTPAQRQQAVQAWSQRMLAHMGVALQVQGTAPTTGPLLVVANHLSWLDILVMNASGPAHFVSKADVKHWPLLGSLIAGAGTLFIERDSRRDTMRVVHHMADALRGGDVLAVFPEGTTSDGSSVLPFHANLLQAAISAHAPVQPVALAYRDAHGQASQAPVYVGDTTLLASLWRTLAADGLQAVVHHGRVQWAEGRDRRAWSTDLRLSIEAMLADTRAVMSLNLTLPSRPVSAGGPQTE